MRPFPSKSPRLLPFSQLPPLLCAGAFALSGCGAALSTGPQPSSDPAGNNTSTDGPADAAASPAGAASAMGAGAVANSTAADTASGAGDVADSPGDSAASGPGASLEGLAPALEPFAYFAGTWTCTIADSSSGAFRWKLEPVLGGQWLAGQVELERPITRDIWGYDAGRAQLVRIAYDVEGMIVQLTSSGWQGDTLIFSGPLSQNGMLMTVREVVRRSSNTEFSARWESLGEGGTWNVMADERCARNP